MEHGASLRKLSLQPGVMLLVSRTQKVVEPGRFPVDALRYKAYASNTDAWEPNFRDRIGSWCRPQAIPGDAFSSTGLDRGANQG